MVAFHALALAVALAGADDTVLLEFSADWCGPCRMVEPTVQRLIAAGHPIRQVDVDRDPSTAARYRVTSVPCFVMLVQGQEVDRVLGAASPDRLLQMLARVGQRASRDSDPRGRTVGVSLGSVAPPPISRAASPAPPPSPAAPPQPLAGAPGNVANAAQRLAAQATVRLQIEDGQGQSLGTGTVIDTHDGEALVITCGHIFRASAGKGTISVDLFAVGSPRTVRGQLVSYDLSRDIGFVSIIPGVEIQPVRVAPAGYPLTRGAEVFSVGCDQGSAPSVIVSRVTAIDKYLGSPNIEVAGQPVQGRSGGGLFGSDGRLIGVCNAADPRDNEGIFAGLATIHWQLDQIGQRAIYQPESPRPQIAADTRPAAHALNSAAPPPAMPVQMAPSPAFNLVSNREAKAGTDTEVICILRSRSGPPTERLLILAHPSAELLERLVRESQPAALRGADMPPRPVTETHSPVGDPQSRPVEELPAGGIIRAQSSD